MMENKKIKKSVLIFALAAISCGWIGALAEKLLEGHLNKGDTPGMGIWLLVPVLTAIGLRIFMKKGWKPLGIKPNFKGNIRWYIAAISIFPAIIALILTIGRIFNWIDLENFYFKEFFIAFITSFAGLIIKNILEELSWRGFLTERLLILDVGDRRLYFITGGIWALWHVPYYLFFLSDIYITAGRIETIIMSFIALACWIIMFSELYLITRSIWPCFILHSMVNSLVIINKYLEIYPGKELFLSYDTGIISLVICVCMGFCLRTYRKRMCKEASRQQIPLNPL